MATSFQPEKPHAEAKGTRGRGPSIVLAVVGALLTMMLFAVAAPRLFPDERTGWIVTIGVGVLVAVAILARGLLKGKGDQPRAE